MALPRWNYATPIAFISLNLLFIQNNNVIVETFTSIRFPTASKDTNEMSINVIFKNITSE